MIRNITWKSHWTDTIHNLDHVDVLLFTTTQLVKKQIKFSRQQFLQFFSFDKNTKTVYTFKLFVETSSKQTNKQTNITMFAVPTICSFEVVYSGWKYHAVPTCVTVQEVQDYWYIDDILGWNGLMWSFSSYSNGVFIFISIVF